MKIISFRQLDFLLSENADRRLKTAIGHYFFRVAGCLTNRASLAPLQTLFEHFTLEWSPTATHYHRFHHQRLVYRTDQVLVDLAYFYFGKLGVPESRHDSCFGLLFGKCWWFLFDSGFALLFAKSIDAWVVFSGFVGCFRSAAAAYHKH